MMMSQSFTIPAFLISSCFLAMTAHAFDSKDYDVNGLRQEGARKGWTFEVGETWVTEYLRNGGNMENITGLKMPADWQKTANFVDVKPADDLPKNYDWRTEVSGGL